MSAPFRIAFIGVDHPHGAGWRELLPHLSEMVTLVALVPCFRGAITSLEERHAHLPRFSSVDELISWGQFDGAIVCLPNAEAPHVVEELARAGRHVLLEKPGAACEAAFTSAANALRDCGVSFQTGYLWRYDPGAERLRQMIAEGRFGKLISIEAGLFTSDVHRRGPGHYLFDPQQSGGGFFNWLACHHLDLIPFLTQTAIVGVTARIGCFGSVPVEVDDGGTVILELASGTLVTIVGGYWLPRWTGENRWSIRGSQRWLHWNPVAPGTGGTFEIHGPQPQFYAMEEQFTLPADTTTGYGGIRGVRLIQDWIASAHPDAQQCRNTIDSTLNTLRLLDLVSQSSREGRRIACLLEPGATRQGERM